MQLNRKIAFDIMLVTDWQKKRGKENDVYIDEYNKFNSDKINTT